MLYELDISNKTYNKQILRWTKFLFYINKLD